MWRTLGHGFVGVRVTAGFSSRFAQQLRALHMIYTATSIFGLVRRGPFLHSVTQSRHRLLRAASEVANEPLQRCEMIRGARQLPRIFFLGAARQALRKTTASWMVAAD